MEIVLDIQTISGAGFDVYLNRALFESGEVGISADGRIVDATNIVGGTLGSEGTIYVGSKQISIDGRTRTITVNDGAINVKGGGGITVSDGGNIQIEDGGDLRMYDSSGNLIIFLGYE
jgi:hypothetical protein